MTTLLTLEIGNPAHGGYCVARVPESVPDLGGKVALVTGALPGELVEAEVVEDRRRMLIARTARVLEPSPDRVPHVWPLAATTDVGGADLGHVAPAAQRRWKEAVIADVMRRIGGVGVAEAVGDVTVRPVPGGTVGWRTRVDFVVDDDARVAMRRSHSHDLVPLEEMPLAVPELEVLDLFSARWGLEPGTSVRAVAPSDSAPVLATPDGVFREPGVTANAKVMERVTLDDESYRYRLQAGGFWQAHRQAPRTLVEEVLRAAQVQPGERILELYSGAGLLTLPLARAVGPKGRVTAFEGTRRAVLDARANLVRHPQARIEVARIDGRQLSSVPGRFDVVVLDPPRSGSGAAVVRAVVSKTPERIVYVACDPAALARDLGDLLAAYELESVEAFDLFPSTHHVEIIAGLRRK